jgi:signal transduction histidine kinase
MSLETAVSPAVVVSDRSGHHRWPLSELWRQSAPAGRYIGGVSALVLAYYAAAHLGYALNFSGPVAAVVWLPVGVAVAFLYLGGLRLWPGVVIGDLLVNNYSTLPVFSALSQTLGNLLEVVVAALLLRRLCPRKEPIGTLRGVAGMVAAIACGTFLSAVIGSLSSWLGGVIEAHSLLYVWRTWFLGDFSGALIVLPLALSWSSLPPRPWRRARVVEASLMMAVVAALSALQLDSSMALDALAFPALIWAALSFGSRGATVATAIICSFAVWGAMNALGAFGVGTINERLLETQLFIAAVSLSSLTIAALVSERGQLAERLRASRARLVEASDLARQQVERDLHDGAQQSLLGLRLKLGQAAEVIRDDPAEGERLVLTVERQMDVVLSELRSIAHGVYPALLAERGIVEAIKSEARLASPDVRVHGDAVGRYSRAVEAAVYFCCLEALQNITKHAGPSARAEVRLRQRGDRLWFEVIDTGVGFDSSNGHRANGLTNMRDRIEAVGGTLKVSSSKGMGTTVRGRVPVR